MGPPGRDASLESTSKTSNKVCTTCRTRRKKCDRRVPVCSGCERNILICIYLEDNVLLDSENPPPESCAGVNTAQTQISSPANEGASTLRSQLLHRQYKLLPLPVQLLPLQRPESKFLYEHYVCRTAHFLSVADKDLNPFLNILLPIAGCSDLVLQAVLAVSGVHLGDQAARYTVATYEHYAQALRAVKHGLTGFVSGQTDLALELLIATLLFCFLEAIRGDQDGHAFRHLDAARRLIPVVVNDTKLSTVGPKTVSFVMEYYAYILAVSSSSQIDRPQYSFVQEVTAVFSSLEVTRDLAAVTLCGCSHELFALIPFTAAELRSSYQSPGPWASASASSKQELRTRVLSWSPDTSYHQDWIIAGKLYQFAILLLLEGRQNFLSPCAADPGADKIVEGAVELLGELPVTSSVTTTLCWPIAVIGSHAHRAEHQRIISHYVSSMEVTYGFRNMTHLRVLLLWLWDNGVLEHAGDIAMAMKSQGITFMLV